MMRKIFDWFLKRSLKFKIIFGVVVLLIISVFVHICYMNKYGNILENVEFSASYADRNGQLLQVFLTEDDKYRIYKPVNQFPPEFKEALLLQEDKYFYSHSGVNFVALAKAGWETYIKKSRRMGASTITMQVAKLKYKIYTKNIFGKIRQIFAAFYLEMCFSKDEILDAYLNLAPVGSNVEGFESGSWYYFNKSVQQLNLSEIIMLCVLPQNPVKRAPTQLKTSSELIDARKVLFRTWVDKHPEDKDKEIFMDMQMSVECAFPNEARHFTEMLYHEKGIKNPKGLTVRTTLDYEKQKKCEELLKLYINQNKTFGVKNGSILLLDWTTMNILANIGSADYYNNEIEGQVNLTTSKRSPGSTLKPFIYGMALDKGIIHYRTMLKDTPQTFNEYTPDNYGSIFKGPVQSWFALADSRNIPAIYLDRELKEYDLYDFMKDCDISGMKEKDHYGLSIVLGTCDVTMLELVELYGILANNGIYSRANYIPNPKASGRKRMLSKESAFIVRKMLEENTPPFQHKPKDIMDVPVAYKTGTSIGFKDSWSVGIFDKYILAVWIGNFDGQGNNSFLGRTMAAPLLFNMAYSLLSDIPKDQLLARELPPENAIQVEVCSVSGALPNEDCPATEWSWFIPGVSPIDKCKIHRKINIDVRTGYRTDETVDENPYVKSIVREFWPSDLQLIFEEAGLPRITPPDYPPEEAKFDYKKQGYPPEIVSPMTGTDYVFRQNHPERNKIMLYANADADTSELLWFNGTDFLGRSNPGETLEWVPGPGFYEITVTDQKGRSDMVFVKVVETLY